MFPIFQHSKQWMSRSEFGLNLFSSLLAFLPLSANLTEECQLHKSRGFVCFLHSMFPKPRTVPVQHECSLNSCWMNNWPTKKHIILIINACLHFAKVLLLLITFYPQVDGMRSVDLPCYWWEHGSRLRLWSQTDQVQILCLQHFVCVSLENLVDICEISF